MTNTKRIDLIAITPTGEVSLGYFDSIEIARRFYNDCDLPIKLGAKYLPVETIEQEARRLRDVVYEKPISDNEWNTCREKWIADIEWLRQQVGKVK